MVETGADEGQRQRPGQRPGLSFQPAGRKSSPHKKHIARVGLELDVLSSSFSFLAFSFGVPPDVFLSYPRLHVPPFENHWSNGASDSEQKVL